MLTCLADNIGTQDAYQSSWIHIVEHDVDRQQVPRNSDCVQSVEFEFELTMIEHVRTRTLYAA